MASIKLFPPNIEGTIPAFIGTTLVVPFSMNKAVSINEIQSMVVKIKTVQNDIFLETIDSDSFNQHEAKFTVNEATYMVGNSYKLQLAYRAKDGSVGYYSTVGVAKYTEKPNLSILGLSVDEPNLLSMDRLVGIYSQLGLDTTEKEFKYRFVISDNDGKPLEDTGYLLHNSTEDIVSYESRDIYQPHINLNAEGNYNLQYFVITRNMLEVHTPIYRISIVEALKPEYVFPIHADLNYDQGYVQISLEDNLVEEGIREVVSGLYELDRKVEGGSWEVLAKFSLQKQLASSWGFKDVTVEQGHTYYYAIRQYAQESGLYSDRKFIMSKPTYVDFEDMFLLDGKRQLRIQFNPKISSFKTDILETKLDTIGGKYPYFFRNGRTEYKEFPISGLISYIEDTEELFMTKEEIGYETDNKHRTSSFDGKNIKTYQDTDLVGENFYSERVFKLAVLDWLNNGEVKVFKSPAEGNYLVRTMSNSLSPNETLGRMIHTFQSNAVEVAPYTYENLIKYNIVQYSEPDTTQMHYQSIPLYEIQKNATEDYVELFTKDFGLEGVAADSVIFEDMLPGTNIQINNQTEKTKNVERPVYHTIGVTGTLILEGIGKITSVKVEAISEENDYVYVEPMGRVTIGYLAEGKTEFNTINKVEYFEEPIKQVLGSNDDIMPQLNNIKDEVVRWANLRFTTRPIENIFYKDEVNWSHKIVLKNRRGQIYSTYGISKNIDSVNLLFADYEHRIPLYYKDKVYGKVYENINGHKPIVGFNEHDVLEWQKNNPDIPSSITPTYLEKTKIYKVRGKNGAITSPEISSFWPDYFYDADLDRFYPFIGSYIDGATRQLFDASEYRPYVIFNHNVMPSVYFKHAKYDENESYYTLNLDEPDRINDGGRVQNNWDNRINYVVVNDKKDFDKGLYYTLEKVYQPATHYNPNGYYAKKGDIIERKPIDRLLPISYEEFQTNEYYSVVYILTNVKDTYSKYLVYYCPHCGHKLILNGSNAFVSEGGSEERYSPKVRNCPNCGKKWRSNLGLEEEVFEKCLATDSGGIKIDMNLRTNGEDSTLSLDETRIFEVHGLNREDIESLYIGKGIMLDTSYIAKRLHFIFEDDKDAYPATYHAYQEWADSVQRYKDFLEQHQNDSDEEYTDEVEQQRLWQGQLCLANYDMLINLLTIADREYKIKHGLISEEE